MNETLGLLLETDAGETVLPSSTLLVGLDETGHELFADPQYPIFGLGGCAVMVRDYPRLIRVPWQYMKNRFFGINDEPLHAAELHKPSGEQLEALGHFFRNSQFSRIAALATDRTVFGEDLACLQIVGRTLLERVGKIAAWYPDAERVALVFEDSQRAVAAMVASVSGYHLTRNEPDGSSTEISMDKFVMPKSCAEPCLEVADFVMHAAGTQTRARLAGVTSPIRKDFLAVFREVDERLTSYIEITRVEPNA